MAYEENGARFSCQLDTGATVGLRCSMGAAARSWEYPSLLDFVREIQVPNRLRVTTRRTSSGVLLGSFSQTIRTFEYDTQGRLMRRTRTGDNNFGTFVLDDTHFIAWDASGRPTRGEMQAGEERETLTLVYDDTRRSVQGSNGESATLDANGNFVHEVEVFGLGPERFQFERDYRITSTAEVCLP